MGRFNDKALLEGAVLSALRDLDQPVTLTWSPEKDFLYIDCPNPGTRVALLLKYSTKKKSPWGFSFPEPQVQRIVTHMSENHGRTLLLGLICHTDGVCIVTTRDLEEDEHINALTTASYTADFDSESDEVSAFTDGFGHYLYALTNGETMAYDATSSSAGNELDLETPDLSSSPSPRVAGWVAAALFDLIDAGNETHDAVDGTSERSENGHWRFTNGCSIRWNDTTETSNVSVRWNASKG